MSRENWLKHYRANKQAIWIKILLTDGREFYYDNFDGWLSVKDICEDEGVFIDKMSLQFRSHEIHVNTNDVDGIYLIRAIMGAIGGTDKHYYVVGEIHGQMVHKKMYIIPELVIDKEFKDPLKNCFEETIIYDERKNGKK